MADNNRHETDNILTTDTEGISSGYGIPLSDASAEAIVTISPDGNVEVNPKYSMTEAAQAFWRAVREYKPLDAARDLLTRLSDDERLELFNEYCKHCGSNDSSCQCWNDE